MGQGGHRGRVIQEVGKKLKKTERAKAKGNNKGSGLCTQESLASPPGTHRVGIPLQRAWGRG